MLSQGTQLHSLISLLIKLADSLRSSLIKIALLTINDMFNLLKRCMEPDLDSLAKVLLRKSSDTNTFISDEAERVLISMCVNCMESKVLSVLLGGTHANCKSNIIRQKISRCLFTVTIIIYIHN